MNETSAEGLRSHADPELLQERLHVLEETQRAVLNILEDFDEERRKYEEMQKATLNLLEDMHEERRRLTEVQRAVMNMLEDIEGERAKAETANVQLESVNRELEAFSYSVSHDLRAPLRGISGFVDALTEDCAPSLDANGMRYLGRIRENAHKMGQLIDDLLAFSRLGRQQMSCSEVDMNVLAKDAFDEQAALVRGRAIEFAAGRVPPAYGDGKLLRQVLVNLLSNAIKFTQNRKEAARVEFGHQAAPEGVAYYVRDNGAGFDMRYAGKLFGVFQRLHDASEYEGTGVGLALVYRIVARHGGRVWAKSAVDEGATFYFSLPRGPDK